MKSNMKLKVGNLRKTYLKEGRLIKKATGTARLGTYSQLVTFVILILVLITTTYAQDKTSEIDKIFSWATPITPGCVCAVSQNGKVVVNRAYGLADLERNVSLSPNSVFDAGSEKTICRSGSSAPGGR